MTQQRSSGRGPLRPDKDEEREGTHSAEAPEAQEAPEAANETDDALAAGEAANEAQNAEAEERASRGEHMPVNVAPQHEDTGDDEDGDEEPEG